MLSKKFAQVDRDFCVACGSCVKVCPREANLCLAGGHRCSGSAALCGVRKMCPGVPGRGHHVRREGGCTMNRSKHWYEYLWIVTPVYLLLGFFNILFAWLGMIFFCVPLIIAIATGNKTYCNRYCDRGQFLTLLGGRLRLSRNRPTPNWMRSRWFRYGFLVFFLVMFLQMLWVTYLVGAGAQSLGQSVKLFWTFRVPWHWAYHGTLLAPWVAQFAFGFYSMMLTSNLIGWIVMALYKPRTWCVFCPMGTMTQLICKAKAGGAQLPCTACGEKEAQT